MRTTYAAHVNKHLLVNLFKHVQDFYQTLLLLSLPQEIMKMNEASRFNLEI